MWPLIVFSLPGPLAPNQAGLTAQTFKFVCYSEDRWWIWWKCSQLSVVRESGEQINVLKEQWAHTQIRKMTLSRVSLLKPVFLFPVMGLPANFLAQGKEKTSVTWTWQEPNANMDHESLSHAHSRTHTQTLLTPVECININTNYDKENLSTHCTCKCERSTCTHINYFPFFLSLREINNNNNNKNDSLTVGLFNFHLGHWKVGHHLEPTNVSQ